MLMLRSLVMSYLLYLSYGPGGIFFTRFRYASSVRNLPTCAPDDGGIGGEYCTCALRASSLRNDVRRSVRAHTQWPILLFSETVGARPSSYMGKYAEKMACDPRNNATCALSVCRKIDAGARRLNAPMNVVAYGMCVLVLILSVLGV